MATMTRIPAYAALATQRVVDTVVYEESVTEELISRIFVDELPGGAPNGRKHHQRKIYII